LYHGWSESTEEYSEGNNARPIKNEGKTPLTIGVMVFEKKSSPIIHMQSTIFNTTNKEYRIRTVDYQDVYPLTDNPDTQEQRHPMLSDIL
jgi:hypothetical protein